MKKHYMVGLFIVFLIVMAAVASSAPVYFTPALESDSSGSYMGSAIGQVPAFYQGTPVAFQELASQQQAVMLIAQTGAEQLGVRNVNSHIVKIDSLGDGRVLVTAKITPVREKAVRKQAKTSSAIELMAFGPLMR